MYFLYIRCGIILRKKYLQQPAENFDCQIFIHLKIFSYLLFEQKVLVNYQAISNQHPERFEPDLLHTRNVGHYYSPFTLTKG